MNLALHHFRVILQRQKKKKKSNLFSSKSSFDHSVRSGSFSIPTILDVKCLKKTVRAPSVHTEYFIRTINKTHTQKMPKDSSLW